MKATKLIVVAAIVVSLSVLTGCGKDEGYRKTTGTVTMGGQPVAGASVRLALRSCFIPTARTAKPVPP